MQTGPLGWVSDLVRSFTLPVDLGDICPPQSRTPTGMNRTPRMGSGPLCVGSGPLTAGSRDSGTKNTQALIKARRGSGADTCPDHTVYTSTLRSGGAPMLPRGMVHVT